jgi:hypothetical protein
MAAVESIGKAPYLLVGSLVLCLLSGYVLKPDTWHSLFTLWAALALFLFGFIVGKIFH